MMTKGTQTKYRASGKAIFSRQNLYRVFVIIFISIFAFACFFPLYWIVAGSFKTAKEINSKTPTLYPRQPTLDNYQRLFAKPALRWLINTVYMAAMAMLLTCLTASLAGYAFAKKRFRGQRLLFTFIIVAMALPKQVILIPLLKEMSVLGLHDNIWAVILPTVGWPFGVFMMKQFSENIPDEMLEAAKIDGAGELLTFRRIVLPMIKPGIGALAIFTFITSWNDYFMQLIMLNSSENLTISLGIAKLQSEMAQDFGLTMAGASLAAVPIIIVFLSFQKYFTEGITMGAVKG